MEIVVLILIVVGYFAFQQHQHQGQNAPFVPTDTAVIERVLDLAQVKKEDIVYDLGSGDGRFVIAAAMRGAKAQGVEMNVLRVLYSRLWIKMLRLPNARIIRNDIFNIDLSDATVVICYLLPKTNELLKEKLERELKSGTRIVSVAFEFVSWHEVKTDYRGVIYGPLRLYIKP